MHVTRRHRALPLLPAHTSDRVLRCPLFADRKRAFGWNFSLCFCLDCAALDVNGSSVLSVFRQQLDVEDENVGMRFGTFFFFFCVFLRCLFMNGVSIFRETFSMVSCSRLRVFFTENFVICQLRQVKTPKGVLIYCGSFFFPFVCFYEFFSEGMQS